MLDAYQVNFTVEGTDVIFRWKSRLAWQILLDGQGYKTGFFRQFQPYEWHNQPVGLGMIAQNHTIQLNQVDPFDTLDSITVLDRTVQNMLPIAAGVLGVFVITLYVIFSAWRERRK